jgi:phospholipid/cholesterol/gamma-HCH transport system substrate-binding protein
VQRLIRDRRLWGAAALVFITVIGLVAAAIYVSPPGDKIVTFYADDASSLSRGLTVRVAGVPFGNIKDLSIESEQVRVRATVKGSVFVGDQSSVQVRMLTPVGGYYVNIDSLGSAPLGDQAIPKERVNLPYSLVRVIADSTKLTDQLQPAPINETLNQLQQGLGGSNVDTFSAIVDAGTKLTDTLQQQRGQITKILDLSDEYLNELAGYRGQLQQMVEKAAILEATFVLYGKGFAGTLVGLGEVLTGLGPVATFYDKHRDEILKKIHYWQQIVRTWADRTGLIVRILQRVRDRMTRTLEAQNAVPELLATDLCIPVAGSSC